MSSCIDDEKWWQKKALQPVVPVALEMLRGGVHFLKVIHGKIAYALSGFQENGHPVNMNMDRSGKSTKERLLKELDTYRQLVDGGLVYSLFDHVPLPYQSLDVDGMILTVNKAWLSMVGYEIDEVRGTWFGNYLTPESKKVLETRFCHFKNEGTVSGAEFVMVRKDGSQFHVSADGRIGYDADGQILQTHCILHDVSHSRQAEKELADNERLLRGLFESSIDGIAFVDGNGSLRDVNPALCTMLGSEREHLLGKSAKDIVIVEDFDKSWPSFVAAVKGKSSRQEVQLFLRHARGERIPVAARFWAAGGDAAGPEGVWAMVKDVSETMKAEAALRRSESQYRRIVETANEGIIGLDASRFIVFSNQVLAEFLGYKRFELLGRPVDDIFFPEDRRRLSRRIVMQDQDQEARYECPFRRQDGSRVWGLVSLSPLASESGEATGSFAMIADITESKANEEALRRSRELLNEAQRISSTGGWDVDVASGVIFWTDEQCRLHGVEPGYQPEDVDSILENFVHPEDRDGMRQRWQAFLQGKAEMRTEYRIIKPDGEVRHFQKVAIPVKNGSGSVVRVYGSTRDFTEEHEAAHELEQAHRRLLSILDGIDADIYVSDLQDTVVLFMNAHMRESFDVQDSTVRCHEIFRRQSAPCIGCHKTGLLDKNGTPLQTLISEGYNSRTGKWYLKHDRAIEWLEGKLVHMHMATDITRLKEMEESLTRAMAEAEAANVAKNEFLANMSHEIRTPLNGLLGMLQILQLTSLVDEQQDYLTTALDSGRSLLQILNDILDLSKIESGMMALEVEVAELGEILDSVVSVFRHVTETRGVSMSWKIDESLPRHFMADKGRLRQILFNLVGNAAKFTESGSVLVEAYPLSAPSEDGGTRVLFSVTDTGIGIPEDKIDLMFDPFTQLDGSASRKYQGTGLGLGIVLRLVKMMHGTISVDSEEGKGTTIAFTAILSPGDALPVEMVPEQEAEIEELTILVAEDEQVNRIVVDRLLSKLGHTVTCVEDGETAVELLRSGQQFDCILMDIQMPGMDGVATTHVIRREFGSAVPVIALTAHAMKGDQRRFMQAGMNGYIAKPFETAQLQGEIRRVMAQDSR